MYDELKTKEGRFLAYINDKAKSMNISIAELITSINIDDLAEEFKKSEAAREAETNANPDVKIADPEWEAVQRAETAKAREEAKAVRKSGL